MSTEVSSASINGNYAPHQAQAQGYVAVDSANATNTSNTATSGHASAPSAPTQQAANAGGNSAADIPKDEVGWYFVEQYYTTLSRSPEKLYLFYNRRSQFVSGTEEEKVPVCVGHKAINDRIKELDFKDTKVRITNVDTQGSDDNIVIQVIGEISNQAQPHRKFVQTFVLAAQTNGYFVLNDIFRYLTEEEEIPEAEEVQEEPTAHPGGYQEPAPTAAEPVEPKPVGGTIETVATEQDAAEVDKQLEEVIKEEEATSKETPAQVNGTPVPETSETAETEEVEEVAATSEEIPSEEPAGAPVVEEPAQPEKPKEAEPAPAAAPPRKASPAPPAVPAAPLKPAVPMTWASRAAAAHRVATPQALAPAAAAPKSQPTPQPQAAAAPATAPAAPAPITPAPAPAPTATAAPPREPSPATSGNDSAGWQTAGGDHKQRQRGSQAQVETTGTRAYIKNVYQSIDQKALEDALVKFGEISYCDISRPKNCAFVDFATTEGFNAAVAANPHRIGNDEIFVEERRPRAASYSYTRGGMRGRGGPDGRPGQGRGGFGKDGARGGYVPRGRGGNVTPRGRGGTQTA